MGLPASTPLNWWCGGVSRVAMVSAVSVDPGGGGGREGSQPASTLAAHSVSANRRARRIILENSGQATLAKRCSR
ncbi:hypothetical protein G6F31_020366 [Rhizopus arrhizus]|nr:hypothetical protein G6F31_020366 [Rhizopus arrhizus]